MGCHWVILGQFMNTIFILFILFSMYELNIFIYMHLFYGLYTRFGCNNNLKKWKWKMKMCVQLLVHTSWVINNNNKDETHVQLLVRVFRKCWWWKEGPGDSQWVPVGCKRGSGAGGSKWSAGGCWGLKTGCWWLALECWWVLEARNEVLVVLVRWLSWAHAGCHGLPWAYVGICWLLWAYVGRHWLLWAHAGCCGLWWALVASVGLRWLSWAYVGWHWPWWAAVGLRGPTLAYVDCCGPTLAYVGCHGPTLAGVVGLR